MTQSRIDLYWHKEKIYNVTKACVMRKKKIVTILRFYNYTIYLNKNDTMLAYYSKQLLFTQMTAKISGMERPTISR